MISDSSGKAPQTAVPERPTKIGGSAPRGTPLSEFVYVRDCFVAREEWVLGEATQSGVCALYNGNLKPMLPEDKIAYWSLWVHP